jgi:hypothetical protein
MDDKQFESGEIIGYGEEVVTGKHIRLEDCAQMVSSIIEALGLIVLESDRGYGGPASYRVVTHAQALELREDRRRMVER